MRFPNRSGLIIGSLIGSALGLLFAKTSGRDLRTRVTRASSAQEKFQILFEEYLKVGRAAVDEMSANESVKDIVAGGREVIAELKKRAVTDGGEAVRYATSRATELIAEVEKTAKSRATRAKVSVAKGAVKTAFRVGEATGKAESAVARGARDAKKAVAAAKKVVRRAPRTAK